MSTKIAFITGITGQDGSYLTELLLEKGYAVHGLVRRASAFNRSRIDHLRANPTIAAGRLVLHYGDLNDLASVRRLLSKIRPTEVYHLAGQSHVGLSFEIPEVTCGENAMAVLGLLEILRDLDGSARFYHASSSEIFGRPVSATQNEETPFNPVNPYGCAKAFATQMCRVYRSAYGLYACSSIAYNHESPRRGENFVTRKISLAAARIKLGLQTELSLGNLDACRDWGYAPEYVEGMWRMLQQEQPDDYVFATGTAHSIEEFLAAAFGSVELNWRDYVRPDARFVRPAEVAHLVGDARKAKAQLGWEARTTMQRVAEIMVQADLAALEHILFR